MHAFYHVRVFWLEKFKEISQAMVLIPDLIIHNKMGARCDFFSFVYNVQALEKGR